MAFLNRVRGWILYPGHLLATSNGGRSWSAVDLHWSAIALAMSGQMVEALTSECRQEPSCHGRDAVRLWRYLPSQDSWIGSPAVRVSQAVQTVGPTFLVDPVSDVTYLTPVWEGGRGSPMLRTSDGGAHWTPLANPCSAMSVHDNPSDTVSVVGGIDSAAVSPSGALWAKCGYGPFPGFNHVLYETVSISDDQGASWGRVDGRLRLRHGRKRHRSLFPNNRRHGQREQRLHPKRDQ